MASNKRRYVPLGERDEMQKNIYRKLTVGMNENEKNKFIEKVSKTLPEHQRKNWDVPISAEHSEELKKEAEEARKKKLRKSGFIGQRTLKSEEANIF